MKDNLVYNHFSGKWMDFERKQYISVIKGIGAGILVSVIMAFMVLLIALGLWGK